MGAFGTEPRENDSALDHELHIFGCEGRDDIGPQDPEEQRYVAWLVMQLKPDFPRLKEFAALSLVRMLALLDNDEWLDNWKDRPAIVASIEGQVQELKKLT